MFAPYLGGTPLKHGTRPQNASVVNQPHLFQRTLQLCRAGPSPAGASCITKVSSAGPWTGQQLSNLGPQPCLPSSTHAHQGTAAAAQAPPDVAIGQHARATGGRLPALAGRMDLAREASGDGLRSCLQESAHASSSTSSSFSRSSLGVAPEHTSTSAVSTRYAPSELADASSCSGGHPSASASSASSTRNHHQQRSGTTKRGTFSYSEVQRNQIRESWDTLMRWSKFFRTRKETSPLESTTKVVVFGGGSFGTAMGALLARQKKDLEVVLLLRDPHLCKDINMQHCNTKYLKDFKLPANMRATTMAPEAIKGAQYAVHAVPVQSSRAFLQGVKDILPPTVPIICVSKGLEVGSGQIMSDLITSALERKQPAVFLSGPSFAKEVMENRPTGLVAASKDAKLAKTVQGLFASPTLRVNTSTDVVGVEICGALKNVLAIAAGIVEGLDLGHNAVAALITQGCSEIRWLAEKLGASPTTVSGLSGLGDIMLTCYGDLSRNRSVGIRLGRGEKIEDIVASSSQVAEGVATAGVVVALARKYRVSLPVLTAVAQVLDGNITPREAVYEIMNLPQIEEV